MANPPLRRLAAVPAALALAATAFAPPAGAAALQRSQNTIDDFSCVFATQEGPTVFFFGSSSDAGAGSAAFVEGDDLYLEGNPKLKAQKADLRSTSPCRATRYDGGTRELPQGMGT